MYLRYISIFFYKLIELNYRVRTHMEEKKILIEAKNLIKTYGEGEAKMFALNGVSINVYEHDFLVILGGSGSGKSTLAKIIMGIIKPTSGKVLYNGDDITNWSIDKRARSGISFSFQQPVKFKGLTVYDLIRLSSEEEMDFTKCCDILSKVGLCAKDKK